MDAREIASIRKRCLELALENAGIGYPDDTILATAKRFEEYVLNGTA